MKANNKNLGWILLPFIISIACLSAIRSTATDLFTTTGPMNVPRELHTATLLRDGRVLVAGGTFNYFTTGTLGTSEIYNPSTQTWQLTGSMNAPRWMHTASLIMAPRVVSHSGKRPERSVSEEVLVAGGQDSSGQPTPSAELYDPISAQWRVASAMNLARAQHTATVLRSGKVLVAGGSGNTSELYDPFMDKWTLTTPMSTARNNATATLLLDGKVLLAGGLNARGVTVNTTELFDPRTESWTLTGSMILGRQYHTATLLNDGRVLVAGGFNSAVTYVASSEIYDPKTGVWTAVTNAMNAARGHHTASLLRDGSVLVIGGYGFGGGLASVLSSAELFNPSSMIWTPISVSIGPPRMNHTATVLRNYAVLIAGGASAVFNPVILSTSELFNSESCTRNTTSNGISNSLHSASCIKIPEIHCERNGAKLRLEGLTGHGPIIIYTSSDLLHWQPFFTNSAAVGTIDILDTSAPDTTRFYRAVEQ